MPKTLDLTEAVRKLREHARQTRRPPSFEEIRELFGYRSKNAAYWLVQKLIAKGVLKKDGKGKLLMEPSGGIRLLGAVQAGFPTPAEEELVDTLNLDEFLVQRPEKSYLVKVSGDSMVDAGIHEGDFVVVERDRQPKPGDVVIAQVDGEWTLKTYDKRQGTVVLVAANKKYPLIKPSGELVVGGVVVAVLRKYR